MSTYSLYAIELTTAGASAYIYQIKTSNIRAARSVFKPVFDGSVDPEFIAVMKMAQVISFTTTDLVNALAKCGISGLAIGAGLTYTGINFYFQQNAPSGLRTGGSVNIKVACAAAFMVPTTLHGALDDITEMSYDVHLVSTDGATEPMAVTVNSALVGTPATTTLYTVGPLWINGAKYLGVQSTDITFGLDVGVIHADGLIHPTEAHVNNRQPIIRSRIIDTASVYTFMQTGVAIASNTKACFRKLTENGTRVAETTAQHVTVTVTSGMAHVESVDAGQNDVPVEMVIEPSFNRTNAILIISTAAAINV